MRTSVGYAVCLYFMLLGGFALADPLSMPVYFARALKTLPAGTVLTSSNVSIGKATDTTQIPRYSMWLTSPDDVYGYKVRRACTRGDNIKGLDLVAPHSQDPTPRQGDPLWSQYAHSAINADKKHDFALSRRYEEGSIAELERMAKDHQHLFYMDDEFLIAEMLGHREEGQSEYESDRAELKKLGKAVSSPVAFGNIDQLKARRKQLDEEQLTRNKKDLARNKRLLTVLSAVLPPKCGQVQRLAERVQEDSDRLNKAISNDKPRQSDIQKLLAARAAKYNFHLPKCESSQASATASMANFEMIQGNYRSALDMFSKALKLDPECAEANDLRGYVRAKLADYQGANDDFDKLMKIAPKDPVARFNRGVVECFRQNWQAAIEDFDQVLSFDNDDAVALFYRGLARERLGDKDWAGDFKRVLTMRVYLSATPIGRHRLAFDPEQVYAYYSRGYNQLPSKVEKQTNSGDPDLQLIDLRSKALETGTIDQYNQLLRLEPNNAFWYYGRGRDRSYLGDYKGAVEDFNMALKLKPDDAHAFHCRGDAREQLGDKEGAAADYDQAAKRDPIYAMTRGFKPR